MTAPTIMAAIAPRGKPNTKSMMIVKNAQTIAPKIIAKKIPAIFSSLPMEEYLIYFYFT